MIYYATTNQIKIDEAEFFFSRKGIEIKPTSIEVNEIQDVDPIVVIKDKAIKSYAKFKKPLEYKKHKVSPFIH